MINKLKKFYEEHKIAIYVIEAIGAVALTGAAAGFALGKNVGYSEGTEDGVTGALVLWYYAAKNGIEVKAEDLENANFVKELLEKFNS